MRPKNKNYWRKNNAHTVRLTFPSRANRFFNIWQLTFTTTQGSRRRRNHAVSAYDTVNASFTSQKVRGKMRRQGLTRSIHIARTLPTSVMQRQRHPHKEALARMSLSNARFVRVQHLLCGDTTCSIIFVLATLTCPFQRMKPFGRSDTLRKRG